MLLKAHKDKMCRGHMLSGNGFLEEVKGFGVVSYVGLGLFLI